MKRPNRLIFTIVILALVGCGFLYFRPLPKIRAESLIGPTASAQPVSITWPTAKESAIGALKFGVLETNGNRKAVPIASITKVVTALAVLRKHPLNIGDQGPTLTLGSRDVGYFENYYTKDGSVVKVTDGEQISEYQALEALL